MVPKATSSQVTVDRCAAKTARGGRESGPACQPGRRLTEATAFNPQEGGYNLDALVDSARAHVRALIHS